MLCCVVIWDWAQLAFEVSNNKNLFNSESCKGLVEDLHSSKLTWKRRGAPLKDYHAVYRALNMGFHVDLGKRTDAVLCGRRVVHESTLCA